MFNKRKLCSCACRGIVTGEWRIYMPNRKIDLRIAKARPEEIKVFLCWAFQYLHIDTLVALGNKLEKEGVSDKEIQKFKAKLKKIKAERRP